MRGGSRYESSGGKARERRDVVAERRKIESVN
jgi:hypothetical protein